MKVKLKNLLYHRDQDRLHGKGKRSGYRLMACLSPRPTQHHVERSLLSLWFLQWEKAGERDIPAPS